MVHGVAMELDTSCRLNSNNIPPFDMEWFEYGRDAVRPASGKISQGDRGQ